MLDDPEGEHTCWFLDWPLCPACGGTLATNGRYVWCGQLGGDKRCTWGHGKTVRLEEVSGGR